MQEQAAQRGRRRHHRPSALPWTAAWKMCVNIIKPASAEQSSSAPSKKKEKNPPKKKKKPRRAGSTPSRPRSDPTRGKKTSWSRRRTSCFSMILECVLWMTRHLGMISYGHNSLSLRFCVGLNPCRVFTREDVLVSRAAKRIRRGCQERNDVVTSIQERWRLTNITVTNGCQEKMEKLS